LPAPARATRKNSRSASVSALDAGGCEGAEAGDSNHSVRAAAELSDCRLTRRARRV
jgi:hypothetical protein